MIRTILIPERPRCSLEVTTTPVCDEMPHGPVVALWDAGPLGLDPLCRECLNESLDFADDMNMPSAGTLGEPDKLTWVMHPADRFCARHCWPAQLCDGWRHGPGNNLFGQNWLDVMPPLVGDLATPLFFGRSIDTMRTPA